MAMAPPLLVNRPARRNWPNGLNAVVAYRETGDGRWENGITWMPLSCDPASGYGDPDCTPTDPDVTEAIGLPKGSSENEEFPENLPIGIYKRITCSSLGKSWTEMQDEATAGLLAMEERRLEQAVWTGDLGNTWNFQTATLLAQTGGTAAVVLGAMERFVLREYGSMGVIHVGLIGLEALIANGLVTIRSGRLETVSGTPVVAGPGYLEDTGGTTFGAAPAGEVWMVGSPLIEGYRSEVFTASNREGDLMDRGVNDRNAIAERRYLLMWEPCGLAYASFDTANY